MIKIEINNQKKRMYIISKEKLEKRKKAKEKFNKEIRKQVRVNEHRYIKSLEYSKNKIVK